MNETRRLRGVRDGDMMMMATVDSIEREGACGTAH